MRNITVTVHPPDGFPRRDLWADAHVRLHWVDRPHGHAFVVYQVRARMGWWEK